MVIDVFVIQLLFKRDVTEEVPLIRRWMEVVASELFSARVAVSPKPAESDPSNVPTDPSRGRYKTAADFGAPYGERLCKLVRRTASTNQSRRSSGLGHNLAKCDHLRCENTCWGA